MVRLLLLLLLLPLLHVWATTPEPCAVDDDDFRCACNFTAPEPEWSSAYQCMSAVEVEIRGGGRSLKQFVKFANTDPRQYADVVRALRLRRLTVGDAQVPALLLFALLRGLGSSRLNHLTLEDLEVIGSTPPPPPEATGPALSTLRLRNVSWAAGGAWLAQLQLWLKPGLTALTIAQAHSLAFPCADLRAFPSLTSLDLSDNPGLDERGLAAALCRDKFPALRELALRSTGVQTPGGVCAALAAAAVRPQHLDLSHNALRAAAAPGAPPCVWPSALSSLNLSSAGLEQVPAGLPAQLSALDLSNNQLNREPRPDELPKVRELALAGNPFQDPKNSGVVSACERLIQALGLSGTLVLLQAARSLA
ncbi:monocyte differentiation antigen CD14 [Pipistrellus kuhlii]|uniref:Monocyte differentiation antigen CD14 n=1 Tax=Pipistrellus kuhlii TaxID=59472 RepID=A0A7J7X9D1_PIPKU|nr:monocyte differentiation antigen CD14 [Pipistrellus kuhlii]KAF6346264.1 CD14 molecule [Pipistrellus kuhlii]